MSREGAGWRFWIAPHTHWDREWYLAVEDFQIRLAHTLDEVIDVLEREPAFRFALDGQAVVLEDYRAIHPECWGRLARLVAEGQMTVGPAYILPDEFLVGQESLVRNLLLGRQACWELGVRPAELGYVPDMFGHVEQLPQILSGFGIDNAIFTRGLGDEEDELGAAFRWRSPDGTRVLAIPQLGGYSGGHMLGHQVGVEEASLARRAERALARLDRFVQEHGGRLVRSGLRDVLVCNGWDHEPIQRDLAAILRRVAEAAPHPGLRIATYEDYVAALRTKAEELPEWQGELLGGRSFPVLRGVNSTRAYLKQANEECERELLAAESLAAMASIAGLCPYPRGELRLAWRGLLKNHPHDSICGCSVDEVHDEMGNRYTRVLRVARRVQQVVLAAIARRRPDWRLAGPGPVTLAGVDGGFSLANPLPWDRRRVVELALAEVDGGGELALQDRAGRRFAAQRAASQSVLAVLPVAGFAAASFRAVRSDGSESGARRVDRRTIENEHYRVRAEREGSLSVTHLPTGVTVRGMHVFEDAGDRGDEYTFCPVEDEPWTSTSERARMEVTQSGPVVAELEIAVHAQLPRRLDEVRTRRSQERVSCPLRTSVRLAAGIDRIELTTTFENAAEDHRLRVGFPAGDAHLALAESPFHLTERPARREARTAWVEQPPHTEHTLGIVQAGGLSLFARGLAEYELSPDADGSHLWLTLLRCVGWLSRDDLATRKGHAGPPLATPGAQCPGVHRFEYALSLAPLEGCALVRAAQDYRFPFVAGPPAAELRSPLLVHGDACFATLKGAEDGEGTVLRLYNPGREPAHARVEGPFDVAAPARLDESVSEPVDLRDASLEPGKILTLRLLPRARHLGEPAPAGSR